MSDLRAELGDLGGRSIMFLIESVCGVILKRGFEMRRMWRRTMWMGVVRMR
jgi:hypothetical protein